MCIANTTSSNNRRSSVLDRSVHQCFCILYSIARRKWRRSTIRGDGCTKRQYDPRSSKYYRHEINIQSPRIHVDVCIFLNDPEHYMILAINSRYRDFGRNIISNILNIFDKLDIFK